MCQCRSHCPGIIQKSSRGSRVLSRASGCRGARDLAAHPAGSPCWRYHLHWLGRGFPRGRLPIHGCAANLRPGHESGRHLHRSSASCDFDAQGDVAGPPPPSRNHRRHDTALRRNRRCERSSARHSTGFERVSMICGVNRTKGSVPLPGSKLSISQRPTGEIVGKTLKAR
jgi:hypothetical protein